MALVNSGFGIYFFGVGSRKGKKEASRRLHLLIIQIIEIDHRPTDGPQMTQKRRK
jgi:hypothetical protein